ncbi:thiamine ABC transporter ATP-binding protein [Aureimonas sp. ME7]|uniref:thiamine ABC transporter ATP-binding protein n=1 Tax=Aureimonas sp. ME7 TaxID=2744252 RepID=UPI0015F60CD3|nr:thiamine ABC transporter ATP-binding protein [Aureimonas sp. ME7]
MSAIELHGVTHAYPGSPMRFDLRVEPGEWLAVIGPSGAGKSTLLDLVAGFLPPDSGTIRLLGRDATRTAPAERPLSVVFQDDNLFPHLTAERNVALGLSPTWRLAPKVRDKARQALARVGLAGLENRRPGELSGGERQRVALARAVLRDRPILLLDEPFAALGPALRGDMLALVAELRREAATPPTIVMVTHHPEDAREHADRMAFLDGGRIALVDTPAAVLSGADPRLAAYLGNTTSRT